MLVVGAGLAGLRCAGALHEVPDALPVQPAPYSARRHTRVGHLFVCGDHRETGSIQGALVSGQRAASDVSAALR